MHTIQLNPRGTRLLDVTDENLQTLRRYRLLDNLRTSAGTIDETTLEKLRRTLRALIASQPDDVQALLDVCVDVVYHRDMKAFGLEQLIQLYEQSEE
ncbi:MAG: hypothetical protein J6N92_00415 [Alloprevotella sp.]|nr:hypothetical protein [Alloprevotella sp.]